MTENENKQQEISDQVTRYYDSLTEEEIAEDRAWGDFAAAQFADNEPSA